MPDGPPGTMESPGEEQEREAPRKRVGRPPGNPSCQVCKVSLQERRIFFRVGFVVAVGWYAPPGKGLGWSWISGGRRPCGRVGG